jgi:hypothetical protein
MSEKPISPLRRRMLEDMNVRRFVPDTQREYIRAVKRLTIFLARSPDSATAEELRAFQLHLTETGVQPPTIKRAATSAIVFERSHEKPGHVGVPFLTSWQWIDRDRACRRSVRRRPRGWPIGACVGS